MDGDDGQAVSPDTAFHTVTPDPSEIVVSKLKGNKVTYIPSSEVFDERPFAKQALENEGKFSYGDNDITLVGRDTLIKALKEIEAEDDDEQEEIDETVSFLEELPASMYIDLEDM